MAHIPAAFRLSWPAAGAVGLLLFGSIGLRAATMAVGQAGQAFSVKLITLAVGDTAVFLNDDDVRHNIRILDEDDAMTDIGIQQPGEKLTYKFTKAGRFRARCGIHPGMKLTVIVK